MPSLDRASRLAPWRHPRPEPRPRPHPARERTRIVGSDALFATGRLQLSSGVASAAADPRYERCAFVPAGPWREPSLQERAALLARPERWDRARAVGLVSLPREAYGSLSLLLRDATDADHPERLAEIAGFEEAFQNTVLSLSRYLASTRGLRVLGPTVRAPGMRTVTTNEAGVRVGLHVDSWDTIHPAGVARNRICLNIGTGARAFFFLPVDVRDLGLWDEARGRVAPLHRIGERLRTDPSLAVVKLTLAPGDAYIAPTESLLHDATTEDCTGYDMTVTMLGEVDLTPSQ
jgi:hypothetical protein